MSARAGIWLTPLLAIAGLAIAGYLTWSHYENDILVCGLGDCSVVQSSEYSTIAGIPIALLGMGMFATVLALALLRTLRPAQADVASAAIVCLTLTSVLYFAYLTYIEIWVLDAICQWCVLSSLVTLAILVLEAARLWKSDNVEP